MEPLLWDTSIQGTLPSRGRKIWSQANILIISSSATSVEGTPLFRGCKIWPRANILIIFLPVTSVEGTPVFRRYKIWPWTNILIIFLSVTSVEGTPLFRGKRQKIFWVPNPRFYLYLGETLVLRTWLTPRRVDKLKSTLIAMIAAFTTCTISHLNEKWCTALVGTTVQQFVREKLTVIFYLTAQKMITAADFRTSINPLLVILLIIPCPTFIQEALPFRRHFLQFCGCTLTGSKLSCLGEQSERRDNALVSDLQGKEGLQQSVINFSLYFAQMRGNTIGWKMTFWKSKLIDNRPSWPALNFRGKHRNTNFQDALIAKTVMLAVRVKVLDCK